jgi:hypothetical protein
VVHLGHCLALIQKHLVVGGARLHDCLYGDVLFRCLALRMVHGPKTAFSNAFIKIVSLLDITDSRAHKHLLANFEGFWPLLFLTFKHLGHNLLHRVFGGGC